jgi:thioredoxin reductase
VEILLVWGVALLAAALGVGFYAANFRRQRRGDAARLTRTREMGMDRATAQHPLIDVGACIGCGSCVAACPEGDVLGIVGGKAVVINGARCIGHGRCAEACPVGAIRVGLGDVTARDDIPLLDTQGQTTVPGLWIAGELSGFALISNAVAQGHDVMGSIAAALDPAGEAGEVYDVVIVGAGPAGMSAALTAHERGLRAVVLDQQGAGGTILHYPRRKLVMVQPVSIPGYGPLPKREYAKEDLLAIWEELHRNHGLDIHIGIRLVGLDGTAGAFTVHTDKGDWSARHVLLALGRRGTPRRLNVPGEDSAKVVYRLIDAEAYKGRHVMIVGGGDSAAEAAVGLAVQDCASVVLSYRKPELLRIKHRNAERIAPLIASGAVEFLGETTVTAIEAGRVLLAGPDGALERPNDDVIVLAGGVPPFPMLHELGIRFGGDQRTPAS